MQQERQHRITARDMELVGIVDPEQLLTLGAPKGWLRKNRWTSIVPEPSLDGRDAWTGLHNADAVEQVEIDYNGPLIPS